MKFIKYLPLSPPPQALPRPYSRPVPGWGTEAGPCSANPAPDLCGLPISTET